MAARVVINQQAFREILNSPAVVADLRRRAEAIAQTADTAANAPGGHRVVTEQGPRRARAAVLTRTPKAMWKEAHQRTLTSSIGAGRS